MEARGIEPAEAVSASVKLGRAEARALATAAKRLVISKGKKVTEFKPAGKTTADMLDAMLGATGNLRAPCIRTGKTVLVGFNEEVYSGVFG